MGEKRWGEGVHGEGNRTFLGSVQSEATTAKASQRVTLVFVVSISLLPDSSGNNGSPTHPPP